MKQIAILTTGIYPCEIGGIQKHSYYLAKGFAKNGLIVDVYHSCHLEFEEISQYFSEKELLLISFIYVKRPTCVKFPGHYVFNSYRHSINLYKAVKNSRYDAIYAQGFTGWNFVKSSLNNILITNLHGLNMFQRAANRKDNMQYQILRIPARSIIRNSKKQISLGGKLTNILYEVGAAKASVIEISNGVETNWINQEIGPGKSDKLKFIFIGRYERLKGVEELNQVINSIIDKDKIEFHFVGPIPKNKKVMHDNIYYHGLLKHEEDIKKLLLASDFLVCPSYSEGMPTVILEAMASGCAIIATDVGAVSLMVDYQNGWLIEGDILTGLGIAINEAVNLSSNELIEKKSVSITRVMANFTWDHVISQTIDAIHNNKC